MYTLHIFADVDTFHESAHHCHIRNDVALWVKQLRGRYDAIFIEPENVNNGAKCQ